MKWRPWSIPARMAATRLPGKPLADIAGLPMIVQVVRRAEAAQIGEIVVATDSEAIAQAVTQHGGRAVMTRADHPSGSDRIFEALGIVDPNGAARIVVNVQGDLPTLAPEAIRAALAPLADPAVEQFAELIAIDLAGQLQRVCPVAKPFGRRSAALAIIIVGLIIAARLRRTGQRRN